MRAQHGGRSPPGVPTQVPRGVPLHALDPAKTAQLRALFASLSDADVLALAPPLKSAADKGVAARTAWEIARDELDDRRVRDQVFAPLTPLVRRGADVAGVRLPDFALRALWSALHAADPPYLARLSERLADRTDPDGAREAGEEVLAICGRLLRDDGPAGRELRARFDAVQPGAAALLDTLLTLAPAAHSMQPRVAAYLRTGSPEHASALRLAYRDAAQHGDEVPPLLLELLAAHLEAPWRVLRLVAAVMERPTDALLSACELSGFAEAVIDGVDARLREVRDFDPAGGAGAGEAAAAAVCDAASALAEFDRSVEVSPSGPWGRRLAAQKRDLSRGVEARLKQADGALGKALSASTSRLAPLGRRGPRLDGPLDPAALERAAALLAFADGVRPAADFAGFASLRAKVIEAMDQRLSDAADELVDALHEAGAEAPEALRARLAFVAEALGRLRDPRAAEVVRRRAAAA